MLGDYARGQVVFLRQAQQLLALEHHVQARVRLTRAQEGVIVIGTTAASEVA
jgi:hypothetical protein